MTSHVGFNVKRGSENRRFCSLFNSEVGIDFLLKLGRKRHPLYLKITRRRHFVEGIVTIANRKRERVRSRQVTAGRTHLTYRRVTQRQVPLKFKRPRLSLTGQTKRSSRTREGGGAIIPQRLSPWRCSPSDDVSRLRGPQKRFERRRSRLFRNDR